MKEFIVLMLIAATFFLSLISFMRYVIPTEQSVKLQAQRMTEKYLEECWASGGCSVEWGERIKTYKRIEN